MEPAVVEKYLSEVPCEARAAIMGLNNDLRWAVYTALVLGGRKYFNEIKGEFKANPNTIGPVLKDLVDSGLVARKIAKFEDFTDKRKVFYEPTGLGLRLFEVLSDVAIPGGRTSREPRAGVTPASASGADAGRDTGTEDRYARRPDTPALRYAADVCRRWKPAREIRNRSARKRAAKQPGLV
ncbi:winged helix-turn-helix transcriptional regulator [Methanoculleus sp. Wushi-C6]|uniref:Winged helix-turn-helix transcriptional regulator n=1 Tax=Methanoculleus caldifontis TaxID=2651577 RepID=A0ABU3X435_9EURY|nr:MarR family winged helix-turn-helix transcriptional regulator [Methanoculleus sp. Wushi-C6]MDV2482798.1 winged helix-turn-helix transcriptional regulator [Methanoculleus sp. Wushi-C6]